MKHYTVVAAIIKHEDRFLCMQRNSSKHAYLSYKYEFPGGKVEPGESNEAALVREIKEELDLDISLEKQYLTVEHEYPDFKLTMHSFLCNSATTEFNLKEHVAFQWLNKTELKSLDWAAADIPIVDKLMTA
ncbi:(deoxy)nucleoside triphosphate pyrophosphohydrolase [Niastella sp. OAS944]|uniref:(deoxy)nucleoside triphosphate pyrophosphohydrolase n=1 Tax=Niastella sp. OAS944 TaxID=2664089 RepID=UPI00346FFC81|nr:8-oxo-dGTP diphosphatase [Chitinophagaceae bacterium OAS944]